MAQNKSPNWHTILLLVAATGSQVAAYAEPVLLKASVSKQAVAEQDARSLSPKTVRRSEIPMPGATQGIAPRQNVVRIPAATTVPAPQVAETPRPPTAVQLAGINAAMQNYQRLYGQTGRQNMVFTGPSNIIDYSPQAAQQDTTAAKARKIPGMAAMLERFKQMRLQGRAQQSKGPQLVAQAATTAPLQAQVAATKPLTAQISVNRLPRWGDKDCLCHDGLRMFKQHRFLEAAYYYHKAGESMLKAWGRPTLDAANALRGEAVSLSAGGRGQQAKEVFHRAINMYITCSNGNPPSELADTIRDLSDTYGALGATRQAYMLKASLPRLCMLTQLNPNRAAYEFASIVN